MLEDIKVE